MTEKDLNKLMTAMQTLFKWIRKKDGANGGVMLVATQDNPEGSIQMKLGCSKLGTGDQNEKREDKIREIATILDAWKPHLHAADYKELKQIAEAILKTVKKKE